ncbi:hypothetical protein KQX54_016943 [Cotesia glomerata]|uniref:Uncharacterized protein n=1 Tax=Cotesia glomerata TaxID=32391 RepID=A0AAV7HWH2_COTGL|nr:hypothetical protein KQX54_016943 [Cotesia glomerata]
MTTGQEDIQQATRSDDVASASEQGLLHLRISYQLWLVYCSLDRAPVHTGERASLESPECVTLPHSVHFQ